MDPTSPNNQNSQGGVEPVVPVTPVEPVTEPTQPVTPEPIAPAEPVAPEPVTPAETVGSEPVAPTEPAVGPAQPVAPESATPVETASVQPPVTEQPAKKKMSGGMITLIIILVALLVGGGIFGVLVATGVVSFGGAGGGGLFSNPTPTAELAKSVCEKYGGRSSGSDEPYGDYAAVLDCENSDVSENIFAYEIIFLKDEKQGEYWQQLKNSLAQSNYEALENSDSYMKVYATETKGGVTMYNFGAMYKNAAIELQTVDGNFGEQLLVELGFPDRSKGGPYTKVDVNAYSQYQLRQYAKKYYDDMTTILYNLNMYVVNNRGQLPEISNNTLVGFDSYLEDDFKDPMTENRYKIVAYNSLAESPYATDQSGLESALNNQMYVFYNASCKNGTLVNSDEKQSFAIVHSSVTDEIIYCISSD